MTSEHYRYETVRDFDPDIEAAHRMRWQAIGELVARGASAVPVASVSRRTWSTLAIAFALATAAFWAIMLTDPPITEAATTFQIDALHRSAPLDLAIASFDAH